MIAFDIEASGLSEQSYPIEIAWVCARTGASDAFLINPLTAPDWTDWDPRAEAIHRIPRERLIEESISVHAAAERLNSALAHKRVVADSERDQQWAERLFLAAGEPQRFRVRDLYQVIRQYHHSTLTTHLLLNERPHRALADAQIIANAIRALPYEAWG